MKILCLTAFLMALPGGDRERGLRLYREGKFAEAAAAFRLALEQDGASAELQWNLALASWRAGDLATAEVAVEKYAASTDAARPELHKGLLGAVRFGEAEVLEAAADEAEAGAAQPVEGSEPVDPLPLVEQALAKAEQAKDYFVEGAAVQADAELLRNTERALGKIAELKKRIEELKKNREQQPDDKQPPKPGDDENQDDNKSGDQNEQQESESKDEKGKPKQDPEGDPKQQESQPGEPDPAKDPGKQSDPKPGEGEGGQEKPEPKPSPSEAEKGEPEQSQQPPTTPEPGGEDPEQSGTEQAPPPPEPKPGEQRSDAPGEGIEGRELTPEQAQRLLERLQELDDKLKKARSRTRRGRKPVERDW